jgi:hypothetical protein
MIDQSVGKSVPLTASRVEGSRQQINMGMLPSGNVSGFLNSLLKKNHKQN